MLRTLVCSWGSCLSRNHVVAYSETHLLEIIGMVIGRALSEPGAWQQYLGIFAKTARSAKREGWTVNRYREGSLVKLIITGARKFIYFEHFL